MFYEPAPSCGSRAMCGNARGPCSEPISWALHRHCRSGTIRDPGEGERCCSQRTCRDSPLEEKDAVETAGSLAVALLTSPSWLSLQNWGTSHTAAAEASGECKQRAEEKTSFFGKGGVQPSDVDFQLRINIFSWTTRGSNWQAYCESTAFLVFVHQVELHNKPSLFLCFETGRPFETAVVSQAFCQAEKA